jgi:ssDNA thymidine ADP-ribosyltransferase DarT-like protein
MNRRVPVPPFGTVGDYVPFYFSPRAPMLYAIHHGYVEGYAGGQSAVIHLVASVEAIARCHLEWVFTDGHADMVPLTSFYNDLADLKYVDWNVMRSRYWFDTNVDPDRKPRRQAEFLVHQLLPWGQVNSIGVLNDAVGDKVRSIIEHCTHVPSVESKSTWYY